MVFEEFESLSRQVKYEYDMMEEKMGTGESIKLNPGIYEGQFKKFEFKVSQINRTPIVESHWVVNGRPFVHPFFVKTGTSIYFFLRFLEALYTYGGTNPNHDRDMFRFIDYTRLETVTTAVGMDSYDKMCYFKISRREGVNYDTLEIMKD